MIKAKNIVKSYGQIQVLKGIDLSVAPGEIVSLVGASGAGKSTLLQILGTLESADQGELTLDSVPLHLQTESQLASIRNQKMGFVFQFHHLLPELTAFENIALPAWISKRNDVRDQVQELAELLGIAHRLDHLPSRMSGGEQQRVAVARASINRPKVVFADEPSGNLDSVNAQSLHQLFQDIRNKYGCSFVIVTHNDALAQAADRQFRMQDGLLISNT